MITPSEYRKRIQKLKRNIYVDGALIGRDDPRIEPAINVYALTYQLAADAELEKLATATSHLTREKINRFCNVHRSVDDLLNKQKMTRAECQRAGGCIGRCTGIDAVNALSVVTYDVDKAYGTEYNKRFTAWLQEFQKNDETASGAQTDVKGDRMLRPHEQKDPDLYLRVVEKKSDGIVVRGAKAHISFATVSDWIIVMPTRRLTKEESDWAVSFAIPSDTEGVKIIDTPSAPRPRKKLKAPYTNFSIPNSFIVFDNVFIPWERVFLCGETEFAGQLGLLFALYHRHSYTGCKPAITDVMMGATALIAEYNGVEQAPHVRDKLAEMISVAELCYGAGIAAAVESKKAPSGTYIPEIVYCNVSRRHAGLNIFHEYETLCDIAGGLPATLPMEGDWLNEETRPFLEKYIMRNPKITAEEQHRAFRFISDLSASAYSATVKYAGLHGGGSPRMEQIAILGNYDLEYRKNLARYLAGIPQKEKGGK